MISTRVVCWNLPVAVREAVLGAAGVLSLAADVGRPEQARDADLLVVYGPEARDAVRAVRQRRGGARVLVLADAHGRPSRAEALADGADDWAPSALDPATAVPRLQALAALVPAGPRTLRLPGCVVDLLSRRVRRADGGEARLTEQEARLLERLAATPGEPVPRDVLLTEVWGYHPNVVSRAPDVAIRRLRTKIEVDPADPRLVVTVHGEGWALQGEARLSTPPEHPARPDDPRFVGREAELARVDAALAEGARLVSLVGAPGVGKSALAARVTAGVPGPVIPVQLRGARTAGDVVRAMAAALDAPLGDVDDVDAAAARLARMLDVRAALVWLDPLECAPAAAPLLRRWLDDAPAARFLVCSRELLRLEGEVALRLAPLPTPEALRLFTRRARDAGWTEQVPEARLLAFVEALDGLPLALELAASRVRSLGLDGLADADGVRLERLRARGRDVSGPRTLEDAVAGSWDALSDEERRVLAAVSLFPEGFDVEAAEAVAGPEATAWVGDVLDALEDKSLLRVASSAAGPRFVVPEAVRWFAGRRLAGDDARRRLVAWAEARRFPVAEADAGNLRAALDVALALHPARGARLALHVDDLLEARTPLSEREALVTQALEAAEAAGDGALTRRLRLHAGDIAWARGRGPTVHDLQALEAEAVAAGDGIGADRVRIALAQAVRAARGPAAETVDLDALVERAADVGIRVDALRERARQHAEAGRWQEARHCLDRALAADRAHDGRQRPRLLLEAARLALDAVRPKEGERLLAEVLRDPTATRDRRIAEAAWSTRGGLLLQEGRADEATSAFEHALALQEELGLHRQAAVTLGNLGVLYAELGDTAESRRAIERALATHRELGSRRSETTAMVNLGQTAVLEGRLDEAGALLARAVGWADASGWRLLAAAGRYGLGMVAALEGDDAAAEAHWAAALEGAEAIEQGWIAALSAAQLGALARADRPDEARAWDARARAHAATTRTPGVIRSVALLGGEALAPEEVEPVEVRLSRMVLEARAAR